MPKTTQEEEPSKIYEYYEHSFDNIANTVKTGISNRIPSKVKEKMWNTMVAHVGKFEQIHRKGNKITKTRRCLTKTCNKSKETKQYMKTIVDKYLNEHRREIVSLASEIAEQYSKSDSIQELVKNTQDTIKPTYQYQPSSVDDALRVYNECVKKNTFRRNVDNEIQKTPTIDKTIRDLMIQKLSPQVSTSVEKELTFNDEEEDFDDFEKQISLPLFKDEQSVKIYLLSTIKICEKQHSIEQLEKLLQKVTKDEQILRVQLKNVTNLKAISEKARNGLKKKFDDEERKKKQAEDNKKKEIDEQLEKYINY